MDTPDSHSCADFDSLVYNCGGWCATVTVTHHRGPVPLEALA